MNDPYIELSVRIDKEVETEVHVSDVIYAANRIPMRYRWNLIAQILKNIELDESKLEDLEDKLTDEQADMITDFLKKQLSRFTESPRPQKHTSDKSGEK